MVGLAIVVLLDVGCAGALAGPTATPMPPPDHSTLAADRREEIPAYSQRFVVYNVPGMDQVTIANIEYKDGLTMDVYYPPDFDFTQNLPVAIFVNGFRDDWLVFEFGSKLKDMGQYISWGQLVAASGMIAIAYESNDPAVDIHDLINYTQANGPWLRVDKDRICLWACSSSSATALYALTDTSAEYRDALSCAVIYYGATSWSGIRYEEEGLSADVPLFIVKAGKDDASLNRQLDQFVEKAREANIPLEFVDYEDGVHAFDSKQDTDESREIIKKTLEFMKTHLFEE